MSAVYAPQVFDVASIEQARQIILTPDEWGTDERWERETPWIGEVAEATLDLGHGKWLLDYGCGIGRLSKEIMRRTGCLAIGADISPSMRALATINVASPRFAAVPSEFMDVGLLRPVCDAAVAVWVLQHCPDLQTEIARLRASLRPGAPLLVVNMTKRCVPTASGWLDDGLDVEALLRSAGFVRKATGLLAPEAACPSLIAESFWAVYRNGR